MRYYDIVSVDSGWACLVDGVRVGSFPTWILAITATKARARADKSAGMETLIRYQNAAGELAPLSPSNASPLSFRYGHDSKRPHVDPVTPVSRNPQST